MDPPHALSPKGEVQIDKANVDELIEKTKVRVDKGIMQTFTDPSLNVINIANYLYYYKSTCGG